MKKKSVTLKQILVVFLFFAVMVAGFVFSATDNEYNYNQQIARGFVSREAVFFDIDNPSYREAYYGVFYFDVDDTIGELNIDTSPKEAIDKEFQLENKEEANGYTSIENVLLAGEGNYYSTMQKGILRGVLYRGAVTLPPVVKGRFFTEEECLENINLAVIGKNLSDSIIDEGGKQYIEYNGRLYKVIGFVGLSGESALDDLLFVNIGSLSLEEQVDGIYYVDSGSNNQILFNDFNNASNKYLGCGLKVRETPLAFIDVVSGGMYMKNYLKVLMVILGLFTYISVFIQTLREEHTKLAVMKLVGISMQKGMNKIVIKQVRLMTIGMIIGLFFNGLLIANGVFSLPPKWIIRTCYILVILEFFMMAFWALLVVCYTLQLNPKEVIQKI